MNYNKRDVLTSLCLMAFIICFAVVCTVFFKGLYYSDAYYLGLDKSTGLSLATIKKNYDILIQYQSIFYQGVLHFPNFVMSKGGRIHFEEVKLIFEAIQVLMIVSGVSAGLLIYQNIQSGRYEFLKLGGILTIAIPSLIGLLASIDFDRAFVMFHQLVFRNDYWIFDRYQDPIINILPETFFMHCFIMIVAIVLIIAVILLITYHCIQKKIYKKYESDI